MSRYKYWPNVITVDTTGNGPMYSVRRANPLQALVWLVGGLIADIKYAGVKRALLHRLNGRR